MGKKERFKSAFNAQAVDYFASEVDDGDIEVYSEGVGREKALIRIVHDGTKYMIDPLVGTRISATDQYSVDGAVAEVVDIIQKLD